MAKQKNVTTKYQIDLSDFKKGLSEIKQNIKLANAQFKSVSAGMDDWKNSTEGLQAKLKQLQSVLDNEVSRLKIYKAELDETEKAEQENAKRAEELKAKLKELADNGVSKTSDEYRRYVKALNDVEKEQLNNHKSAENLRIIVLNQQAAVNKTAKEMRTYKNRLDEVKSSSKHLDGASDDVSEGLENIGDSAKNASDDLKELDEGFTVLKGAASNLLAEGIQKLIGGFKDFGKELIENEKAIYKFQSKTGTSAKEMKNFKKVMQELYAENFGESISDIADSMAVVAQTSKEVDPTKIKELTKNAILLRDTFDYDVNESMRAANMLMDQFGLSGEAAFNLIAQGAQTGLDKNGDLLDVINEYSAHYRKLGYTSEEFFNSLANGASEGTFSVDKLGDAMKEFGIRARDTATTTTEGFELIGLNADEMRKRFAAGGESAKKATQETIKALFGLNDEVKRNQAGVDLFGTMWEDLGEDAIKSMMNINGGIKTTNNALKEIEVNNVKDLGSQFTALGRDVKNDLIYPIGNELMPVLKGVAKEAIPPIKDAVSFMIKNAIPLGSGVLGIATAWGAYKVAQKAANTITAVTTALMKLSTVSVKANTTATIVNTTATKGATAATKALSLAQKMTPWGMVAGLVAGAVVGLVAYAAATRKANEKTYESVEATKKLVEGQKALNDSLNENVNSRKEAQESAETQAATADVLFQKIEQLNGVEKKSAAQKSTMKKLVSELNEIMPELNLKYNAEKDALNMSTDAIRRNITAQKDLILAKAAQENLTSIAKDIAALEVENGKLAEQHAKNEAAWKKAREELDYAIKTGAKDIGEIGEKEATLRKAYEASGEALDKNTNKLKELNGECDNTLNYSEKMANRAELQEKLNALTETCLKAGVKIPEAVSKGIKSSAYAIPKSVEGMKELISFQSLESKAKESGIKIPDSLAKGMADGSIAPSKAIEKLRKLISFESILKKSNFAGVEIPESISEGIMSGKLTPQKAIEKMESSVDFSNMLDKASSAGTEVPKKLEVGILSGNKPLKKVVEKMGTAVLNELNKVPPKADTAGKNSGYSYTSGVKTQTSNAYQAGSSIGSSAVKGTEAGSAGSATVGTNTGDNYVKGVGKNKEAAHSAGVAIADKSVKGAKSRYDKMYQAGTYIAGGILKGVADSIPDVGDTMGKLVDAALYALNKAAEIRSPAKAFSRRSKFIPLGVSEGIDRYKHVVVKSIENMMSDSLKSSESMGDGFVKNTMNSFRQKVNGLKNEIIPVGEMKSRLSNISNSMQNKAHFNNGDKSVAANSKTTHIVYNQYITSPKATDRMEIRRQSINTLRMVRGRA